MTKDFVDFIISISYGAVVGLVASGLALWALKQTRRLDETKK